MKKTILTLILILTTSLISFSQLTYSINGGTPISTDGDITVTTCDTIKIITDGGSTITTFSLTTLPVPGGQIDTIRISANEFRFTSDVNYHLQCSLGSPNGYNFGTTVQNCGDTSTASVSEREIEITELIAYPNPTVGEIKIAFNTNNTKTPIYIFALNGQLVYHDTEPRDIGTNRFELNVSHFSSGLYLIKVGNEVFKFVKINR